MLTVSTMFLLSTLVFLELAARAPVMVEIGEGHVSDDGGEALARQSPLKEGATTMSRGIESCHRAQSL